MKLELMVRLINQVPSSTNPSINRPNLLPSRQDDHHLDHLSTKSHAAAGLQEGSLESWEENVREEERAWLTGPRPRDWWTGACVSLSVYLWGYGGLSGVGCGCVCKRESETSSSPRSFIPHPHNHPPTWHPNQAPFPSPATPARGSCPMGA